MRAEITSSTCTLDVKAVLGSYSNFLLASYHEFLTLNTVLQIKNKKSQVLQNKSTLKKLSK